MKILITGCCGFIGFHLAETLLNSGKTIIGLDNINSYYDIELKKLRLAKLKKYKNKFIFYKFDIKNKSKLESVFVNNNIRYVYHMAAQAGVRHSILHPREYLDNNIIVFFNILELTKKYKIEHLITASSSSVYGDSPKVPYRENQLISEPVSFYAATKASNELMAHAYSHLFNMKISCLRFFTVYGTYYRPDMALYKFTENILSNKKIDVYNHGKHKRDFTHVSDVVNLMIKMIKIRTIIF